MEKIGLEVQVQAAQAAKSVGELKKALEDAKKQAADIGKAFGENSDEFKKAEKQIAGIVTQFQKFGNNKADLRESKVLLQGIIDAYGATSKEAIAAAKAAANFKDNIGDADKLIAAFDPDAKFVAFSGAIQSVVGGFAALQGAIGLFGGESKEVEQVLLKVQSALALSQGINSILQAKESFQNLGNVIVSRVLPAFKGFKGALLATGIGAIAVAVGYLAANFDELKDALGFTSKAQDVLNETMDDYKKGATDAIVKVNEVSSAFSLARKGVISKKEALKIYNDTLGDSLGRTNDLGIAEKNLLDKADAYIEITALKARANALFAKSAEQTANSLTAGAEDQTNFIQKGVSGLKTMVFGAAAGYKSIVEDQIKAAEKVGKLADVNAKILNDAGIDMLEQVTTLEKKYKISDKNQSASIHTEKVASTKKNNNELLELQKKYKEEALKSQREIQIELLSLNLSDKQKEQAEASKQFTERFDTLTKSGQDTLLAYVSFKEKLKEIDAKYRIEKKAEDDADFAEIAERTAAIENKKTQIIIENTDKRRTFSELSKEEQIQSLEAVGAALNSFSQLAGEQTVVGKALAVAGALINTYLAGTKALASAPPPFNYIALAGTIAAGLATVKKIVSVKVPAKSGGSGAGGIGSISSPSLPQAAAPPQAVSNVTTLDKDAINALGNQALRAYVVENDITNSQGRIQRIKRSAILG